MKADTNKQAYRDTRPSMSASEHARQERIELDKLEALKAYPRLWRDLVLAWRSDGPEDTAWLMYSANYLFRCGNVRWAVDPITLPHRLQQAGLPDLGADLQALNFVLLSHRHSDHYNLQVIRDMRHLPACWVVPAGLMPKVAVPDGLPQERLDVAAPLKPVEYEGFRITPFDSLHWEASSASQRSLYPNGLLGVPETGYLVEHNGKRWLFPGDIRCYDPASMPDFGPVDAVFAHVWLGRGAASAPDPRMLDKFCQFYLALRPTRIVLTHLQEWGRQAPDFWDRGHANAILAAIHEQAPGIQVEIAVTGDKIVL